MLENPKPFITVLALALLAAAGCYNFDEVFDDCVAAGRCKPTACDPSAADAPDDLFFDNNCDGLDGMADAGVSWTLAAARTPPRRARASGPTRRSPTRCGRCPGHATVYLAQGTYDEPGLKVGKPVSLHGGYSGVDGNWARASTNVTQFGGGSIGLTVSGLGDAGVTLGGCTSTPRRAGGQRALDRAAGAGFQRRAPAPCRDSRRGRDGWPGGLQRRWLEPDGRRRGRRSGFQRGQ